MSWHAIFVETGKEDTVRSIMVDLLQHIRYENDYELLIPKRRMQEKHQGEFIEVTSNMFLGYILVRTNEISDLFQRTKGCSHLYRFLKLNDEFQEITLEEITNIIYMADEDGVIGISDIFIENDMVKVTAGPLCNYTGWIKKIDKHKRRVMVLFKFQGQDHLIDLSVNYIRKPSEEEVKTEFPYFRR